jgi:hypothetical protein
MAQFNLIRGIKVSRIASSTVSMPSPNDSLKATVNLRVEGTPEVRNKLVIVNCRVIVLVLNTCC